MKTLIFVSLLLLSLSCFAKMYKWVDAEGNTHYGETPPDRQKAKNIAPPPPPALGSNKPSSLKNLREGILKQTEDKAKSKEESAKKAIEDKERSAYCDNMRKRLAQFQTRPRIRQQDKDGNYAYLGDEQKQTQQQEMQKKIAKHCG